MNWHGKHKMAGERESEEGSALDRVVTEGLIRSDICLKPWVVSQSRQDPSKLSLTQKGLFLAHIKSTGLGNSPSSNSSCFNLMAHHLNPECHRKKKKKTSEWTAQKLCNDSVQKRHTPFSRNSHTVQTNHTEAWKNVGMGY
jgi:hypothetical protein